MTSESSSQPWSTFNDISRRELIQPERTDGGTGEASNPTESQTVFEKDSKRAWLVCLAGFLIQIIHVGFLHTFGILFVALLKEFKAGKAGTAWLGSAAYGVAMIFAPVASSLVNRFGNRPVTIAGSLICSISLLISSFMPSLVGLFITFSFFYGFGCCLSYTPTMTIAGEYFSKYITLATGIMVAGSSAGTLVLSPLAQLLIDGLGWRGTLRVFAGISLIPIGGEVFFRPLEGSHKTVAQKIKASLARRFIAEMYLWKSRVFVVWICGIFCVMFGYYIPYVHLVSHAVDIGIPADRAALLMMFLGGSTATGRILFGKIVEWRILNRLHMHQLSMVVTGTGTMILPLIGSFEGLATYVILVGLVDGCYVVLLPVLTSTLVGQENAGTAWGLLTGVSSITYTLGPPVAGWIFDAYGNYDVAFHVAGIPVITGAIILFFIPWAKRTGKSINILKAARETYNDLTLSGIVTEVTSDESDGHVTDSDDGTEMVTVNLDRPENANSEIQQRVLEDTSLAGGSSKSSVEIMQETMSMEVTNNVSREGSAFAVTSPSPANTISGETSSVVLSGVSDNPNTVHDAESINPEEYSAANQQMDSTFVRRPSRESDLSEVSGNKSLSRRTSLQEQNNLSLSHTLSELECFKEITDLMNIGVANDRSSWRQSVSMGGSLVGSGLASPSDITSANLSPFPQVSIGGSHMGSGLASPSDYSNLSPFPPGTPLSGSSPFTIPPANNQATSPCVSPFPGNNLPPVPENTILKSSPVASPLSVIDDTLQFQFDEVEPQQQSPFGSPLPISGSPYSGATRIPGLPAVITAGVIQDPVEAAKFIGELPNTDKPHSGEEQNLMEFSGQGLVEQDQSLDPLDPTWTPENLLDQDKEAEQKDETVTPPPSPNHTNNNAGLSLSETYVKL